MNDQERNRLAEKIFCISNEREFRKLALEVFRFQAKDNRIYSRYLELLKMDVSAIDDIGQIPFLPVEFFKSEKIMCGEKYAQCVFTSSATTADQVSRHHIADISLYKKSFRTGFELFYGSPERYCLLALLPSYLEREASSLVFMMDELIRSTGHPGSGFYLYDHERLSQTLSHLREEGQATVLAGVTFALLDFAASHPLHFPELIIMETGGMKGRREELVREDVHDRLKKAFGVHAVHSEYGMTELLSQAYSKGEGLFRCPPWMSVMIRESNDPFSAAEPGKTGGINIIDLANLDSCSFIETQDMGKRFADGSFEVMGRFDNSDIRGCNLML